MRPPHWSMARTVVTCGVVGLSAVLVTHGLIVSLVWWQALLLGMGVGAPLGWYGGHSVC